VTANVQAGCRWSSDPMLLGWYESAGQALGAVGMTPPYELLPAMVPGSALAPLVDSLPGRGIDLPGVTGEATLHEFAAAWSRHSHVRAMRSRQERLYRLRGLVPPAR